MRYLIWLVLGLMGTGFIVLPTRTAELFRCDMLPGRARILGAAILAYLLLSIIAASGRELPAALKRSGATVEEQGGAGQESADGVKQEPRP